MNNGPLNKSSLSRATIAAAGLAVAGIVLFLILWGVLGSMGFESLPRLIGALCIPPAVLAVIIGAYILIVRPGNNTPKT